MTCDSLLSGEAFHFRIGDAFVRLWLVVFAAFERPIQALMTFSDLKKQKGKRTAMAKSVAANSSGRVDSHSNFVDLFNVAFQRRSGI